VYETVQQASHLPLTDEAERIRDELVAVAIRNLLQRDDVTDAEKLAVRDTLKTGMDIAKELEEASMSVDPENGNEEFESYFDEATKAEAKSQQKTLSEYAREFPEKRLKNRMYSDDSWFHWAAFAGQDRLAKLHEKYPGDKNDQVIMHLWTNLAPDTVKSSFFCAITAYFDESMSSELFKLLTTGGSPDRREAAIDRLFGASSMVGRANFLAFVSEHPEHKQINYANLVSSLDSIILGIDVFQKFGNVDEDTAKRIQGAIVDIINAGKNWRHKVNVTAYIGDPVPGGEQGPGATNAFYDYKLPDVLPFFAEGVFDADKFVRSTRITLRDSVIRKKV